MSRVCVEVIAESVWLELKIFVESVPNIYIFGETRIVEAMMLVELFAQALLWTNHRNQNRASLVTAAESPGRISYSSEFGAFLGIWVFASLLSNNSVISTDDARPFIRTSVSSFSTPISLLAGEIAISQTCIPVQRSRDIPVSHSQIRIPSNEGPSKVYCHGRGQTGDCRLAYGVSYPTKRPRELQRSKP